MRRTHTNGSCFICTHIVKDSDLERDSPCGKENLRSSGEDGHQEEREERGRSDGSNVSGKTWWKKGRSVEFTFIHGGAEMIVSDITSLRRPERSQLCDCY